MVLSIVIPVYNVEKYIDRCLSSIYCQDFSIDKFEVIVVNDGTPDNSIAIVNKYIEKYSNIKLINQVNQGLSVARNSGMAQAKGDYIWFIDSDDWITKDSLSYLFPYLDKNHDLLATNLIYAYDNSDRNHKERIVENDLLINSSDYIAHYSVGASQRFIISRKFLAKHNLQFYPGIYHEDAEFNVRLVYFAANVFLFKESLYMYYQGNGQSIMSNWKLKNSEDYYFVYGHLTEFWKKIVSSDLKMVCRIYTFNVLLMSISLSDREDLRSFYGRVKGEIKMEALRLLLSKDISNKLRVKFLLCGISPLLFKKLLQNTKRI
jgi:glycosyltransferase involved in cell wall biosynthesis